MKPIRSQVFSASSLCTMGLAWIVLMVPLPHAHAEPSCSWRFTASGGVITDHNTQLSWQQNLGVTGTTQCFVDQMNGCYSANEAYLYCFSLSLAGGGWRMPTIFELSTILEDDGTMDLQFQGNGAVWSSSRYASSMGSSWYLANKWTDYAPDTEGFYVRCVR